MTTTNDNAARLAAAEASEAAGRLRAEAAAAEARRDPNAGRLAELADMATAAEALAWRAVQRPAAAPQPAAPRPIAPARYAARKISDPRSRGACYWYEVESVDADGRRAFVAVADTRDEARDLVRRLAAAAKSAPTT